MSKRFIPVAALLVVTALASSAEAGWGLRNSFGQSIYLVQPTITPPAINADGSISTDKLISGCGNVLCYDGNRRRPIDFEFMPYYNFGLLSIDMGIVFQMESRNDLGFAFQFRPGVRIFPFMGLFVRAFVNLNLAQLMAAPSSTGALRATFEGNLGIGVGYQLKLGPWGGFAEIGFAPRLWGEGPFNMPFEVRLGILLEPS